MCKIFSRNFLFSSLVSCTTGWKTERLKCADRLNQSKIHILQVSRFSSLVADENARNRVKLVNHSPLSRRMHAQLKDEKKATSSRTDLGNKTSENKVYDSKFRPHSQSALKSAVVCWFCTRTNDSARLWRKMNFYLFLALKELLFARKVCSPRNFHFATRK